MTFDCTSIPARPRKPYTKRVQRCAACRHGIRGRWHWTVSGYPEKPGLAKVNGTYHHACIPAGMGQYAVKTYRCPADKARDAKQLRLRHYKGRIALPIIGKVFVPKWRRWGLKILNRRFHAAV